MKRIAIASRRKTRPSQRPWLLVAALSSFLAACTTAPTVEFHAPIQVAPNVMFNLTVASGFRGTVEFRCRGNPPVRVTIVGNEDTITLVSGGTALILEGGPYRYIASGQRVEFEPGYTELEWRTAAGRRSCRR